MSPPPITGVDVEALVSKYLRASPDITALVDDRVYTDLPHDRVFPLVLVQRTGGNFLVTRPLWLEQADLTLSAFGGTHKQAQQLVATCLSTLGGLRGRHSDGAVTGISVASTAYQPDPDSADTEGHARPRFVAVLSVLTHP